jgi:hypothetical protein
MGIEGEIRNSLRVDQFNPSLGAEHLAPHPLHHTQHLSVFEALTASEAASDIAGIDQKRVLTARVRREFGL